MFKNDLDNVRRPVKNQVLENFGKFKFPYFEIIHRMMLNVKKEIGTDIKL
jgi:hypothetical protein